MFVLFVFLAPSLYVEKHFKKSLNNKKNFICCMQYMLIMTVKRQHILLVCLY